MGMDVRYNGAQPERLGGSHVHGAPRFRSTRFHPARSRAAGWAVVCPVPGAGEIETLTFVDSASGFTSEAENIECSNNDRLRCPNDPENSTSPEGETRAIAS
jgi:hypothetical protein